MGGGASKAAQAAGKFLRASKSSTPAADTASGGREANENDVNEAIARKKLARRSKDRNKRGGVRGAQISDEMLKQYVPRVVDKPPLSRKAIKKSLQKHFIFQVGPDVLGKRPRPSFARALGSWHRTQFSTLLELQLWICAAAVCLRTRIPKGGRASLSPKPTPPSSLRK